MKAYFFSGLGADKKAFGQLQFPENIDPVFIDWIQPLPDEPIESYAKRISGSIDDSQPFILVGLSFGGIMATEVIEFVSPHKTILISSVSRRQELPSFFQVTRFLGIHKTLPVKSVQKGNAFVYCLFGIEKDYQKTLLNEILVDTDPVFAEWAIRKIMIWKRESTNTRIVRIHGDNDKMFPIRNFTPDYTIKDGGHFMVIDKAPEISMLMKKIFSSE